MTGLPDLDDIAEDDTAAVIIITLARDGMLDLHSYEAEGIEVDTSDVIRCALKLSEDDEISGKLN